MLIDQANFNANISKSATLDINWIANYFLDSELMYVRDNICVDLYNEIDTQKGSNTLTVPNAALLAKLYKPISLFIIYHTLPIIHSRIQNVGVMKAITDDAEAVSDGSLQALRQYYLGNANFWLNEAIKFIKDNISDYPLFNCGCDSASKDKWRNTLYLKW